MSECEDCKQEMTRVRSCDLKFRCIRINGVIYPRDTLCFDYNKSCHDCGIDNKVGNLHHFGCDVEKCPKCKCQVLSCSCNKQSIGINSNWKELKRKIKNDI